MEGQEQAPKLLVQVRNVLRLHHYSIHTERSYVDWMKRYIYFHHMRCREDLADGERKIEAFLTDLAVRGKVAAWIQNQALNGVKSWNRFGTLRRILVVGFVSFPPPPSA